MSEWEDRHQASLINAFGRPQLALARGQGAHVWDIDGTEYIDFLGGIAVNSLGHNHPALVGAVTEQLQTLGHVANFFATEPQVKLAEELIELWGITSRVFFSNSGSEANEAAFKITRRTGRTHLVAAEGAFHGRTMGALALTSKQAYRTPFEPLPGEVTFVPYGDIDALEAAVTDQTAAVILEPIQGEAGVRVPDYDYLPRAAGVAHSRGALLWLDEIQTGIGRTGGWFAHRNPDLTGSVNADIVTLAKGLGGGIPIGATLASEQAARLIEPGNHGTTFGGNPVACAAALAVLETIRAEDMLDRVTALGHTLRDGLQKDPRVAEVRGAGLLVGIDLTSDLGPATVAAARELGFIMNATGPKTVRLAPPLVVTDDDVATLLEQWPAILDLAEAAR